MQSIIKQDTRINQSKSKKKYQLSNGSQEFNQCIYIILRHKALLCAHLTPQSCEKGVVIKSTDVGGRTSFNVNYS